MANISDERLLAAVRGYVDTIGRANDIGEIRRNINSSVTKIESTSYRSTFPRQVKFRVGANGELSAFGPTAGKRDLSRALTDLRDRRRASTDERTDEDTRIDETINTLLGSLDVAINRAERIEQAANREYDELVANLSEMAERSENRENGNDENEGSYEYPLTNRPVNFVMDTEGRVSTTGSISNRTVIANRIDDLIQSDRLTPEVRTYAESLLSDMRDSIAREVAANDRSENANIRAELEASEGEVRYENYQELHRRIREIGEVDRTTPPEEKRRTDNFGIKPGVLVSRVQDTDLQSMLDSVVGFRYDRDGNFRAYSGNIRQKRLMLVRLQNMLGLDELSDEDKVVVNRLIQGLSRDVDRQITEERQADQNRNEEEQTTDEQQTEQENAQGEQETEQENTQEPEQEYENREIEAVTRETIQDRINYYEGILANQNRMQPVLTTISREDARRYQEINRQRAEREANSNSNLPEDLSYDQDRINQELSRSDLSTDERTRLLDLQNSRQYQEIVNNRTRELDALIEERRNALDARRTEIESSPRTVREEVETDLDINNFPRISDEDFIRTVLRQNGVSEEEIDATINEYSMETVEDANGLYDDGPLSRSIVVRTRTIEPGSRETETREPVEGMDNLYIETYGNGRLQGQDLVRAILRQEMNMSEEEINENINNYDVEVRDGAEGMDDGVVTPIRLVRVTRNQPELTDAEREELDGMQAEIDTLTRERDNLINADITRSPEEETAFINGLENVSDETKNRINMLMSTYQYTITTERETEQVSEADIQRANDILPELRDLLSRTSDEKPYVEASEIDSRLDAYRAERDALLARANGENTNDTPELSPEDRIRAQAIRYRMSQILGREVPELDGIENEDEHAIQNQLDDNEIDRFQELREEFNNDSTTPARKAELRIMMAQVLGRVVPELEGIENEDEHAIQNQLDDNEIDEFQELREGLREINQRGDNTQDRDAQRREEIDRQLEELRRSESSYSAAIDLLNESPQNVTVNEDVNTLQDRLNSIREQIARLEEERQQLEGNQNRAPLTDAERRRLEQLNNIISELESLTRERVTERVPVDRTHDDDGHGRGDDDDGHGRDDDDDGHGHDDDDDGHGHGDDDDGHGHDDDDDGHGHDDDDDGHGHDDDDDGHGHDDDDDGHGHDDDDDGHGHDDDDDGHGHDDDDDGHGHDDDDDGHKHDLTTRGFWRIVADTSYDGPQATSRAITLRNLAHAKLGPTSVKDGGVGWLGLPVAAVMLPVKLGAKAINAIGNKKTENQFQEMCANLRDLRDNHPDEWNVLLNGEPGPNGHNMYGLVHESTSRQYKLNDLYMQAVMEVLGEETGDRVEFSDNYRAVNQQNAEEIDQRMTEAREAVANTVGNRVQVNGRQFNAEDAKLLLSDKTYCDRATIAEIEGMENDLINAGVFTREQLDRMIANYQAMRQERNAYSSRDISAESLTERKVVEQYKAVERAMFNKSRNRDNYGPTFPFFKLFAKTNPDNRDLIEEMAERHDMVREARGRGDEQTARDQEFEMVQTLEKNTETKHFGPIVITRGKAQREKTTVIPSDRDDTRSRQIMANVALTAAVVNFANAMIQNNKIASEQLRLDQEHAAHNTHLDQVNQNNLQVEQDYQNALNQIKSYSQTATPDQGTYEAFKTVTDGNIQGLLARYHDSFTVSANQVAGGAWDFAKDAQVHQMVEQMNSQYLSAVQQADALAQAGNFQGAINTILQFNQNTIEPEIVSSMQYQMGVLQQAINSGSQYSSTYQSMVDVTREALAQRGNLNNLLQNAAQSITVPTVSGTIQSASHIGDFNIAIDSSVIPAAVVLGATMGNAAFGEDIRRRENASRGQEEQRDNDQERDNQENNDQDRDQGEDR